jgi:hypothetical protein
MAAADAVAGAGEFSLSGGFWTFTLNEPLALGLDIEVNGDTVILTWDDSAGIPVVLERSADLQIWASVDPLPANPPFLESTVWRQFYRLMPVP